MEGDDGEGYDAQGYDGHDAQDGQDANSPDDHTSPAGSTTKSGRPAPSCDVCRRLKIKCERQRSGDRCMQCISRDLVCKSTLKVKKPRVKRPEQLDSMESRIRQMESALASALTLPSKETDMEQDISKQAGISDNLSIIVINEHGGSGFVGASSGFSLFSPRGLRWICEKTDYQNIDQLVQQIRLLDPGSFGQGSAYSNVNIAWHPLPEAEREPLPDKQTALVYVNAYFENLNLIFPLLNKAIFNSRFERQYSHNPPTEVGWYACLNMVLAIGSAILNTSHPLVYTQFPPTPYKPGDLEEPSGRYLRNATSTLIDLQFGPASLMSIQAILGMAIMLQGSSNPLSIYNLVAIATQLAHAIGLHRWLDDFGLSEDQADERRNVFWHLYNVDQSLSLQTGRPSIIHDQDIGIALPRDVPLSFDDGQPIINTFLITVRLAMIQSRVYSELYSARARTRTVLQRLVSIGKLDTKLQEWKDAIPVEIRPEKQIQCDPRQILPVSFLHYAYYSTMTAIHRVSIFHGTWTNDLNDPKLARHDMNLNPRVFQSEAICVEAARHSINTLGYLENDRTIAMLWIAISQPLQSSLTLFANILQHPLDDLAVADLNQIQHTIVSLERMLANGRLHFATTSLWVFQELYAIAQLFQARKTLEAQQLSTQPPPDTVKVSHSDEENLSFYPQPELKYPNGYSQDGVFSDNMLMFAASQQSFNAMPDMGDFPTPDDSWFSPMDV